MVFQSLHWKRKSILYFLLLLLLLFDFFFLSTLGFNYSIFTQYWNTFEFVTWTIEDEREEEREEHDDEGENKWKSIRKHIVLSSVSICALFHIKLTSVDNISKQRTKMSAIFKCANTKINCLHAVQHAL